jgi:hypothetical protein
MVCTLISLFNMVLNILARVIRIFLSGTRKKHVIQAEISHTRSHHSQSHMISLYTENPKDSTKDLE